MAAEDSATFSIEVALPLYRSARVEVKEAALELLGAGEAAGGDPPAAFQEELARLTTSLQGQQRALIRALNDHFRSSLVGGRVLLTRGVNEKGQGFVTAALAAVHSGRCAVARVSEIAPEPLFDAAYMQGVSGDDMPAQRAFVHRIFGLAA